MQDVGGCGWRDWRARKRTAYVPRYVGIRAVQRKDDRMDRMAVEGVESNQSSETSDRTKQLDFF